ncbi:MAG TPA: hypothetical protein ENK06_13880 [Gammaproteobacteria bacterium]|nr:hypothetical protein [Gammaproteobacteria bacterium]
MENHAEMVDVAVWLSLAIFFAAITLWLNVKYRGIDPKLNDIREAINWLKTNDSFKLDRFSALMLENKTLNDAWEAFHHTLHRDPNRIIATRKAAQYFNESVVDSGNVDIRFISAIPGYLLSVGLLFTFIGLLLALNAAVELSQSGDIASSSLALQGLLGAASFKFLTSISGLFSSILFSVALRKNLQKSRNLLDELCHELDSRLTYETAETITLRQMTEARMHNEQLLSSNQSIADNQNSMIIQLRSAISDLQLSINENNQHLSMHANTFEQSITDLLEETRQINSTFISDLRQANQDSMVTMVNEFVEKFNRETQSRFKDISKQLNQAQNNFSKITENLQNAGRIFQTNISNSGDVIQKKITQASLTLNKSFGTSADNMMSTTHNVEKILLSLHQVMDKLYKGSEAILEANKNIAPVSKRFEATTRDFIAVIPEISGLTSHFKKFYSIFNEFNTNMRAIDKEKVSELTELVAFSRKSTELVKEYHSASLEINKELKTSIDAFHNLMLTLDQGIKRMSSNVDETDKKWNQVN